MTAPAAMSMTPRNRVVGCMECIRSSWATSYDGAALHRNRRRPPDRPDSYMRRQMRPARQVERDIARDVRIWQYECCPRDELFLPPLTSRCGAVTERTKEVPGLVRRRP